MKIGMGRFGALWDRARHSAQARQNSARLAMLGDYYLADIGLNRDDLRVARPRGLSVRHL